jgi:hypothetical protein
MDQGMTTANVVVFFVWARPHDTVAERGIVLSRLPARAGAWEGQFWRVLNGSASPTVAWLERVATVLEVTVADLVQPPRA